MSAMAEPGAMTRAAAARAVAQVLAHGRTLDAAFEVSGLATLQGPDRAQARALAYGAVRWHHRHRALLSRLLHRPLPPRESLLEALLSVGLFQVLDEAQPDYAAVSSTVAAARILGREHAAGLVNATLRRMQREREALLAGLDPAARASAPAWLHARLAADWPGEAQAVCAAWQSPPPLWLRVNSARTSSEAVLADFARAGVEARPGPVDGALLMPEPLPVEDIPGFPAGLVSVQDLAAQLAAPLLDARPGMRVLDACAAPGGKTGHLLERARGDLDLLALDIDPARLGRVRQNLDRLGLAATLHEADAAAPAGWWDGRPFDRILVDAPCSGTGVIRRHPDVKLLRRESDIPALAARQLALLEALWPLLAPGGQLLYATCSVLREENEAVARGFLAARPDARVVDAALPPGLAHPCGGQGQQVLPGVGTTDGLYYVLMARGTR